MAEISKPVSWEQLGGLGGAGKEEKMEVSHQQGELQSKTQKSDSFVLDMESLSLVASTNDADSTATPRNPLKLQKTLSRKGSQRIERKAVPGDTLHASSRGSCLAGPATTSEDTVIVLPSPAGAAETASAPPHATTAARRYHGGRRASPFSSSFSPWLNPRRVLFFFATLSSMGTIILLYFTLSMSKMDGDDANSR